MGIFSNYCGLGGSGPTQHVVDQLCKAHDEAYERYIQAGYSPYMAFNRADANFLDSLYKLKRYAGIREELVAQSAKGFFELKRVFASHIPEGKSFFNLQSRCHV